MDGNTALSMAAYHTHCVQRWQNPFPLLFCEHHFDVVQTFTCNYVRASRTCGASCSQLEHTLIVLLVARSGVLQPYVSLEVDWYSDMYFKISFLEREEDIVTTCFNLCQRTALCQPAAIATIVSSMDASSHFQCIRGYLGVPFVQ